MVAVIKSSTAIRRTFYYNEDKVKEGVARLLCAANYPLNTADTSELLRLSILENMAALKPNVARPGMHISLNFAAGEQLSDEKMLQIATDYMEGIGFGDQPYLLYPHMDAGHPHLHIVSLRVRPDGTTIDTFNIGKKRSQPVQEALEIKYNLVKAKDHKAGLFRLKPIDARRLEYGKVTTKQAISNILASVLDGYRYTSLTELNAVLKLYNVRAERGLEDSRLFKSRGLLYRVTDQDGNGIGVPLKASLFGYDATLDKVEKRFLRNDVLRQQSKKATRHSIEDALGKSDVLSLPAFQAALKRSGIDLVMHLAKTGQVHGLTYVDHRHKTVFNGSDLGTGYSAKHIAERLAENIKALQAPYSSLLKARTVPQNQDSKTVSDIPAMAGSKAASTSITDQSLIEALLQPESGKDYLPYELRKTKRKKRKRKSNNL